MRKSTRAWLVAAVSLTTYLIYLVGCAAFFNGDRIVAVRVLPFFSMWEWYQVASLLNWCFGITLAFWLAWGIQFFRESRSN